jgi:hypothetical protein
VLRTPELRLYLQSPQSFVARPYLTYHCQLQEEEEEFRTSSSRLAYAPTPKASMLCLFASRCARLTCEWTASVTKLVHPQPSIALRLEAKLRNVRST